MLSPRYTLFLPSVRNDHDEIPRRQEREAFGIVLSYPNSIQRIQLSTFVRCAISVCLSSVYAGESIQKKYLWDQELGNAETDENKMYIVERVQT
jgi:hypothetical protein